MRWLVGVVAGAWALALGVQASGHAGGLHHDALVSGGFSVGAVAAFVAVWQVHVAAVMLPSSLPLMSRFGVVVARRPRPERLRAAFLIGYAGIWTAFAVAALAVDGVVHRVVAAWTWLDRRPGLVVSAVLVGAGLYQFSGLKARCLHACRRPDTFLRLHYRRGAAAALGLGARHGLFCLGCCWALMVVMVAVGVADLRWMAPLALVMAVEKTARSGTRLTTPVGAGLVGLGLALPALAGTYGG